MIYMIICIYGIPVYPWKTSFQVPTFPGEQQHHHWNHFQHHFFHDQLHGVHDFLHGRLEEHMDGRFMIRKCLAFGHLLWKMDENESFMDDMSEFNGIHNF